MKQYSEQCVISKGYVLSGRSLSVLRHQLSFLFLVAISVHSYDHSWRCFTATTLPIQYNYSHSNENIPTITFVYNYRLLLINFIAPFSIVYPPKQDLIDDNNRFLTYQYMYSLIIAYIWFSYC
jgi:hypothetical protein